MERTNTLTPGGSSVIKVGICAMNKKTSSRPMREILSRLKRFHLLEFIIFPDETVLHESIENWPIVDCLVSWYSTGFPLHKVIEYVNLRKPHLLNDLEIQYTLQDRRAVYRILQENGIDTPRYAVFERDENNKPLNGADEIEESDDAIIVNGTTFKKPFVEKPANAEDHDIYIYYPSAAGGGCQVLFRKIGNRSSIYSSRSKIRRDGSYIYEDFLRTDGTDVKIYTVGLEYAHAEARKSPALDGIVDRDLQGKEIRYPVILSAHEKMIARKVTKAFKQTVCGFDLLRANGQSLVCDVNGFSFVKTSSKYYDDCSQLLADCIARNLAPQHWKPAVHHLPQLIREESMSRLDEEYEEEDWELRSVVAIMRHGDRTPKQKMKMVVHHKLFFDFFQQYDGDVEGRLKLKKPKHLHEVLDIINRLIDNFDDPDLQPIDENQSKLKQMKNVLEMYGHFDGINRKVQIKAMHDKRNEGMFSKLHGRNEHTGPTETRSLLVIVKWGGELTPMGKNQAENLGKAFRRVYQAGEARFGRVPGCGLLRLHSTYRHDLKIYASDEGRVQMTAAAFAKGLLALEGELTPILVSLVKSDKNATKMLDSPGLTNPIMQRVKSRLHNFMRLSSDLTTEEIAQLAPGRHSSVTRALTNVHNPRKACETLYGLVVKLTQQITDLCEGDNQRMLYHKETLTLMKHRWEKLKKDFQNEDEFDISLIPDIYDCIKYDYLHNSDLGLKGLPELYKRSKALADVVIPQEYGITSEEKLRIAKELGGSFFSKIQSDLQHNVKELNEWTHRLDPRESRDVQNPHQHVRSRLYFTSESHVHAVINSLKHGILAQGLSNGQWTNAQRHLENTAELNYLTQIVFMQYENLHADPSSEDRFRIEVFFSPGVKTPINATVATQLQAQSLGNSKDYVVKKTVEDDLTLKTKAVNARQRLSLTYPSKLTEQNGFQSPSSTLEEAVDVRGAEIIETLPSLHPLVKLHSLLKQTHMDKLLNEMVSEESSTTMLESTGKNETEVASGLGYM